MRIVQANSKYHATVRGIKSLTFRAGHRSVIPGRLLSVGLLAGANDVILPEDGYAQFQCFFCYAPSGELILEDATTGHHTYIDWYDCQGKQDKYSLQGDPRRRVIPRAEPRMISICFGQYASFQFIWHVSTAAEDVASVGLQLARIAANTHVNDQRAILAVPRIPNLDSTAYEARTINTPDVPVEYDGQPLRQIHVYNKIGSGHFGNVSKAVDLATGRIWAVKECRRPDNSLVAESWKAEFKREVETLARYSHPNIIRLEHHQGWSLGRPVQIFFQLCQGSVFDILPAHNCYKNPSAAMLVPWFTEFVNQVLSGLAFMHRNGVVHRDLKPQNVLFRTISTVWHFYISDFGLAASFSSVKGIAGDVHYMSPESTRYAKFTRASDIYSFGMTILEVLNKYCPSEGELSESQWREKLKNFRVRNYRDYKDRLPANAVVPAAQPAHSRVLSLGEYGLLRPSVTRILTSDPRRRTTAMQARQELLADYAVGGTRTSQSGIIENRGPGGGHQPPPTVVEHQLGSNHLKCRLERMDDREPSLDLRDQTTLRRAIPEQAPPINPPMDFFEPRIMEVASKINTRSRHGNRASNSTAALRSQEDGRMDFPVCAR
ncbi:Serine/threonine-protein kinase PrkC [Paramyrothecium foliicola]|nr:Serine/threonine-protein kinase PrkC [Paramyrothecium foliicola]